MKSILKIIAVLTIVIGLLPVSFFFAYDFLYFQPRMTEIKSFITFASGEEKNLSVTATKLLEIEFRNKEYIYASKLILHKLNPASTRQNNLYQHFESAIWSGLIKFHLSIKEQQIIIATQSPMGNNIIGFSAAAEYLFNKKLTSLSAQELATIIALTRAPGAYSLSEDHLNRRRDFLLKELSNYYLVE